jgi:hypothetical protein
MTSLKVMSFPRKQNSSHGLTGHGLKATIIRTEGLMKKYFLLTICATFSILSHAQTTWFHQSATQEVFNLHVQTCQNNAQLAIARQQAPQLSPEQQRINTLNEAIALAQLSPAERGAAMTYSGARGLGGAIAGALGVQDPQTQRYMQLMFNQCMFGLGYQLQN